MSFFTSEDLQFDLIWCSSQSRKENYEAKLWTNSRPNQIFYDLFSFKFEDILSFRIINLQKLMLWSFISSVPDIWANQQIRTPLQELPEFCWTCPWPQSWPRPPPAADRPPVTPPGTTMWSEGAMHSELIGPKYLIHFREESTITNLCR